jgi:hypothetical protein
MSARRKSCRATAPPRGASSDPRPRRSADRRGSYLERRRKDLRCHSSLFCWRWLAFTDASAACHRSGWPAKSNGRKTRKAPKCGRPIIFERKPSSIKQKCCFVKQPLLSNGHTSSWEITLRCVCATLYRTFWPRERDRFGHSQIRIAEFFCSSSHMAEGPAALASVPVILRFLPSGASISYRELAGSSEIQILIGYGGGMDRKRWLLDQGERATPVAESRNTGTYKITLLRHSV